MPTYEFACPKCLKKGKLSEWEMQFGMSEPKKSFCPACGTAGKQVIRTAPAIATHSKQHKLADNLTFEELNRRGASDWTPPPVVSTEDRIEMTEIARAEPPPEPKVIPPVPELPPNTDFRPHAVAVDGAILAQGQAASAAQRAVTGNKTALSSLPSKLPTEMITMKDDPTVNKDGSVTTHEVSG